jgi:Ni/Fe-hydrogenase subunit HybB-like protein
MKMQRVITALATGFGAGYAAVSFVAWSFNSMEWNPVQRAAVLIIAAVVAGIMEGGKE